MSWTSQEVNKLVELCEVGISNKAIAVELDKPVNDIYAKRSQMCITIDKVAEKKKAGIVNPEFENTLPKVPLKKDNEIESKRRLIKLLQPAIMKADPNIKELKLSESGNVVEIIYVSGYIKGINIEGDSDLAILADVCRICM